MKLSGYRTGIQIQRHTGWISVRLSKLSQVNEAYHERVPDSSEGWEKQRVREEMGTVLSKKLTLRKVRSLIPHFQKLKVRVDLNLLALVTLTAFPSILRLLHCLNLSLRVGQPFQLSTPSPCFFMCTVAWNVQLHPILTALLDISEAFLYQTPTSSKEAYASLKMLKYSRCQQGP